MNAVHPRPRQRFTRFAMALIASLSIGMTAAADHSALQTHSAIYHSRALGMDVTARQTLKQLDNGDWQLHESVEKLFYRVEEEGLYRSTEQGLQPLRYDYRNNMSSKRSFSALFDHEKNVVRSASSGKDWTLPLSENVFDKLGYQLQVRCLLRAADGDWKTREFTLVDNGKLKTYRLEKLADEAIVTPMGELKTVKLRMQRAGKADYTLIWMARDWDYLLARLERIDEGKSALIVELVSAQMGGKKAP